jgi:two-component system nitrate/nitrite response regulator NarL
LKLLLKEKSNLKIVAEANAAEVILELLRTTPVDVLLTDIMMPGLGGYELSLHVKKEHPSVKILALSMSEDGAMIAKMMEHAKIDGYIPKASGQKELIKAIETILSGNTYFSEEIIRQYNSYKIIKTENKTLNLTNREMEIIECLFQHFSNKQIADKLFISERTVETHRKNIYRKTNTRGEASLMRFVKEHQLIP